MPIRRILLVVFASVTLVSTLFGSNKDKDRETAALIDRAKELSDIRAEDATPFLLKMTFKIMKDDGSVSEGTYTELWVSREQWRKEWVLGGFRRTQIVVGRKSWTLDSAPTEPFGLNNIPGLLDPMGWLSGRLKIKSLEDRSINGALVRCFSNATSFGKSESCFDKNNGSLALHVSPIPWTPNVNSAYLYTDYKKFGDRILATSYENTNGQKVRSQGSLEELSFRPEFDQSMFEPPSGARQTAYCAGKMQVLKVIEQVKAVAPRKGDQTVTVLAIIGEDGTARDIRVSKPADEDFDQAAISAVRQWRFNAATCDGDPVEMPFAAKIVFH